MPHHRACAKHMRASAKRRMHNRMAASRLRTAINRVRQAKGKDEAKAALISAFSIIDKSAKTGLIHKNTAANKKSRLTKLIARLPD